MKLNCHYCLDKYSDIVYQLAIEVNMDISTLTNLIETKKNYFKNDAKWYGYLFWLQRLENLYREQLKNDNNK